MQGDSQCWRHAFATLNGMHMTARAKEDQEPLKMAHLSRRALHTASAGACQPPHWFAVDSEDEAPAAQNPADPEDEAPDYAALCPDVYKNQ
jgi:hypothetical protein